MSTFFGGSLILKLRQPHAVSLTPTLTPVCPNFLPNYHTATTLLCIWLIPPRHAVVRREWQVQRPAQHQTQLARRRTQGELGRPGARNGRHPERHVE